MHYLCLHNIIIMKQRLFSTIIILSLAVAALAQSTSDTYRAYIAKYASWAQEQQREHGVPASITLAQGLLESAAGQSELARKANNHFGIKCGGGWMGPTYRQDDDTRNECFRKYRNVGDSFRDHSLFLKRNRYAPLFKLKVTDYKGWAHGLKQCGYATDPHYAAKLIKIIETYDLARYSLLKGEENTPKSTPVVPDAKPEAISKQESKLHQSIGTIALIIEHEVLRNNGKRYVIAREGDTFLSIAQEFNMYDSTLRRYNDIINPHYELQPGDKVYLQKKRKKATRKDATHRVKANETIWQIAQDKGIRLQTIYELNNIPEGENVTVNQELRLR